MARMLWIDTLLSDDITSGSDHLESLMGAFDTNDTRLARGIVLLSESCHKVRGLPLLTCFIA